MNSLHARIAHSPMPIVMLLFYLLFAAAAHAQTGLILAKAPTPAASSKESAQIQALINAIQNDKTRKELINALEKVKGEPSKQNSMEGIARKGVSSFGRDIAEFTQSVAQKAAASAQEGLSQLMLAPQRMSALSGDEVHLFLNDVRDVVLSIITTYIILLLLRRLAIGLYRRIGAHANDAGLLRRAFAIIISALIDAAVVVLAWAAGYLITLFVFGKFGEIGLRQSLYLNAFLVVELILAVLRIALSPSTGSLRLINISDKAARLLSRRLAWIVAILGYGQLFVTPIFYGNISYAAGQAISVLFSLIALGVAVSVTVRKRHEVSNWLVRQTTDRTEPSHTARFLAGSWYLFALVYYVFLFVVVLTQPATGLLPVLVATAKVVAALLFGLGITGWLGKINRRHVQLPEYISIRLPLLEGRINAFIPHVLTTVRFVISVTILLFVLNVMGAIDIVGWLGTKVGVQLMAVVVSVLLIPFVSFLIWLAMISWVDYRLNPDYGTVPTTRETTLLTLLRNVVTIVLIVIAVMFVLSELGVDIAPLIASAGVFGLALGFGAQKLVQDVITGVFIQLENAINVGDVVTAGGATGVAERLTIRSVSLRDINGTYHIIPFSSVDKVSNFMKGFSYSVCNMGVAYRENYDDVKDAMFAAFELLRQDEDNRSGVLGNLEWFGVTEFGDNAVVVRTRIKTLPGKQWGIGRAYNRYIKQVFDDRNIEIPFPHRTLYFGQDRSGNAPVGHIRVAPDEGKVVANTEGRSPEREPIGKLSNAPPANAEGQDSAEGQH